MAGDETSTDDLGSLASLIERVAEAPGVKPVLPAGTLVGGKFRVERWIGAGAMGVVYLARDVRLDREVALKLGVALSARGVERVEREAMALARLSHPNVVVVHEVGEVEGRMFIAMEYVAGGTARQWIAASPRTPREVLALYLGAGEGLAAAHASGLVHRDFKPDNVLVGDNRPRVADFGLAYAVADLPAERVAGTRAYMAPEQLDGEGGALADQYAFCASLWEALFGARPEPDPEAHAGPAHVVAALRRGLARDAEQRWEDMDGLLAALRRDPAARRRRLLALGGVGIVAAGAAVALTVSIAGRGPAPCEGDTGIAEVWNRGRAERLLERFRGAGAATIGSNARSRIDTFATAWDAGSRAACTAARVDGTQSDATFARRSLCLFSARTRLEATLETLERADREGLAEANDAVSLLPDVSRCADVAALDAQAPLPVAPEKRAEISVAVAQLAHARVLEEGAGDDALALADATLARARATGWQPLVAEAMFHAAGVHRVRKRPVAGIDHESAIAIALASGSDEIAAWTMADVAWIAGDDDDAPTARRWGRLAHALWEKLGRPDSLGVRVLGALAGAEIAAGQHEAALALTREQVALAARAFTDPLDVAANHVNLARALGYAGHHAEAQAEMTAAIARALAVTNADHPTIGRYLVTAGSLASLGGDLDGALRLATQGLAIIERRYGGDDPRLIVGLEVLADVQRVRGDARARGTFERVVALRRPAGPSVTLAHELVNLGIARVGENELVAALAAGVEALPMLEAAFGQSDPELINTLLLLGYCERGLHHTDASVGHLARAVAIADGAYGPDALERINPRVELATTLHAGGLRAQAIATLAPAIELAKRTSAPDEVAGEARALWRTLGGAP